jgi:hypothetical protein
VPANPYRHEIPHDNMGDGGARSIHFRSCVAGDRTSHFCRRSRREPSAAGNAPDVLRVGAWARRRDTETVPSAQQNPVIMNLLLILQKARLSQIEGQCRLKGAV